MLDYVILHSLTLTLSSNSLHHVSTPALCVLVCACKLFFVFVGFLSDRWRCEGQSVVGVGPHLYSIWEEADEKVGEPAPNRPTVSTGCPLTCVEEHHVVSQFLSFSFTPLQNKDEHQKHVSTVSQ